MKTFSETFNSIDSKDWHYINATYTMIHERFKWMKIPNKNEDRIYPWTHRTDIEKLFLLCMSFNDKTNFLTWANEHLGYQFNSIHLDLIDLFFCSENTYTLSIDERIDNSTDKCLLQFILFVLDRALTWYNPSYVWPSEFTRIIVNASEKIKESDITNLEQKNKTDFIGKDLDVIDTYNTQAFLNFELLINEIANKEISFDIKLLAKQAHETLLTSIDSFFLEFAFSTVTESQFYKQIDILRFKESDWCLSLLD